MIQKKGLDNIKISYNICLQLTQVEEKMFMLHLYIFPRNQMWLMSNLCINNQPTKERIVIHILNIVLLVVIIQKSCIEFKYQLVKKYQVAHQDYEWQGKAVLQEKPLRTKTLPKCGLKDDSKTLYRLCPNYLMKVLTVKKHIIRNGKKMTLSYVMNMPTGERFRFRDVAETSKGLGKNRMAKKSF